MGLEGLQLKLTEAEKKKIDVYLVPAGTFIWPETTGSGVVQEGFYADKIPKKKIKGLSGFRTRSLVTLYHDGHYRSLPTGARFGAYSINLHRRTLTL